MSLARIPADWPHRAASEIVHAGGLSWHVQQLGAGPAVLLVHGTAASTHSFRKLAEALAGDFRVVMADLPGHGFTGAMTAPTLERVAQATGALLDRLDIAPVVIAGHSAGAAVAARMALDGLARPEAVVGLAPALRPYGGALSGAFSACTRIAFDNPLTPRLLAMRAEPGRVARMIAGTGSHLDETGAGYYTRLLKRPEHVAGALRLMAHWKLDRLAADLPDLKTPLVLAAGDADTATPAADAEAEARRIPSARFVRLSGLGHLLHEEDPAAAARLIREAAALAHAEKELRHA